MMFNCSSSSFAKLIDQIQIVWWNVQPVRDGEHTNKKCKSEVTATAAAVVVVLL